MRTSENGIRLIKYFEGCRLTAYKCPAGVWTIGYGHTAGVKEGMTITQAQADKYLIEDLEKFEKIVLFFNPTYKFNQNEFDALVSFTYNCGYGNLKNLTKNGTRTKSQIASHITAYNKSNGNILAGLVKRRAAEKELFLTLVSEDNSSYYDKYTGNSTAIDAVFEEIGATVDYDYLAKKKYLQRLPIAEANGITDYKGTAVQNQTLVSLAKNGKLRRV